jgi:hypothetical protein
MLREPIAWLRLAEFIDSTALSPRGFLHWITMGHYFGAAPQSPMVKTLRCWADLLLPLKLWQPFVHLHIVLTRRKSILIIEVLERAATLTPLAS